MRRVRWGQIAVTIIFSGCGLVAAFFVEAATKQVIINEVMWDGDEYIELYNATDQPVNLKSWHLQRQAAGGEVKTITEFSDTDQLEAHGYYVIAKKDTTVSVSVQKVLSSLSLLNTGEQLTLVKDTGDVSDVANPLGMWVAGANTTTGQAMERNTPPGDGTQASNWHTATTSLGGRDGSPGAANSQPLVNTAPTAVISGVSMGTVSTPLEFSGEDSTDPEDQSLQYTWDFGDGTSPASTSDVTHSFSKSGIFTVSLTVSDGALSNQVTKAVTITAPNYAKNIVISEVLPNPSGSDTTGEYIELQNLEATPADISGWQLDDGDGGSAPYTFPTGTTLSAASYAAFMRSVTKLALNNSGDSARLLDPTGKVVSSFTYTETVPENVSYNRSAADHYVLSTTLTPGSANIITAPTAHDSDDESDAATTTNSASASKTGRVAGAQVKTVALEDIREEEPGTIITTAGIISTPPGVLGEKIMYLAGSGIQVYLGSGQWPELKLGDQVSVTGELSSVQGEARLKVSQAGDISKQKSTAPPEPHQIATGEIDESWEGSLVIIQGKVTETSGDTFYVDDDSGEVKVVIKSSTNIKKPKMKKGDEVTITGVVSRTNAGYRILPRFQEDVRQGRVAGLRAFPKTGQLNLLELLQDVVWSVVWRVATHAFA